MRKPNQHMYRTSHIKELLVSYIANYNGHTPTSKLIVCFVIAIFIPFFSACQNIGPTFSYSYRNNDEKCGEKL